MSNTLEALESRRLLSVTLQNGLLRIVGTAGDDLIKVKHPLNDTGTRWDQTRTIVEINGEQSFFRTGQIRKLIINGREGNDQFRIGFNPPLACRPLCGMPEELQVDVFVPPIPMLLVGGAGADSIIGGQGRDRIFGGDGDDTLFGGWGNDLVDGGAGDDQLDGGGGNDILIGAGGNDELNGIDGNDKLIAGDGNDTLRANSASDFLSGGDGDDLLRYSVYGQSIDGSPMPPPFKVPADIEATEASRDVRPRLRASA